MKKKIMVLGIGIVFLLGVAVLYARTRPRPVVRPSVASVYQDSQYGFELTTTARCTGDLLVQKEEKISTAGAIAAYGLYVKNSVQWKKNVVWQSYEVMPKAVFDAIDPRELPGRPRVIVVLENGNVLTSYGPQDGPSDMGTCGILGRPLR